MHLERSGKGLEFKMKILIVEDNDTIVEGLKFSLEHKNFKVSVSKTIKEAKIEILNNLYNLVILDILLPDGDGIDLCKYIKEKKNTPVIFLTAKDEEKDVVFMLVMFFYDNRL